MWRALALMGAMVLLIMASGCSSSGLGVQPPCLPPEYSVTPSEARPGQRVTVTAPVADCDPRYGDNARIQIILTDASGTEAVNTTAPMDDGGAFTYAFVLPAQTAPGNATVTAVPHNIDWCDDTGRNNRAASNTDAGVERASCVMPVKPLAVIR